jgi:hypothetical protein
VAAHQRGRHHDGRGAASAESRGSPRKKKAAQDVRLAVPITGTGHPPDIWRPGSTTTSSAASPLNDSIYPDPVINPAPRAFDRSRWPTLY